MVDSSLTYFIYYDKAMEPLKIIICTGSNKNFIHYALSRIQINSLDPTRHSADNDDNCYIPSTVSPIGVFKKQLIFKIGQTSQYRLEFFFQ